MKSQEAKDAVSDLGAWTIHRPAHADVLRACRIQRQHKISSWDALIVNSAIELGCDVLWREDLAARRKYGTLTIRNPFAS
jgi:predicted nucleic acid-binding protein